MGTLPCVSASARITQVPYLGPLSKIARVQKIARFHMNGVGGEPTGLHQLAPVQRVLCANDCLRCEHSRRGICSDRDLLVSQPREGSPALSSPVNCTGTGGFSLHQRLEGIRWSLMLGGSEAKPTAVRYVTLDQHLSNCWARPFDVKCKARPRLRQRGLLRLDDCGGDARRTRLNSARASLSTSNFSDGEFLSQFLSQLTQGLFWAKR